MARFTRAELDSFFPSPRLPAIQGGAGWNWSSLAPNQESLELQWVQGLEPGQDVGQVIAEKSIDRAGLISSFGTAELLRGLAINPGIGIQESKPGLLGSMQNLANERYTLPIAGGAGGDSWLKNLDVDIFSFVKFESGKIRFSPNELSERLASAAIDQVASAAMGAAASIPYVGWLVSALMGVGRIVANRRKLLGKNAQSTWSGQALSSGLCRIPSVSSVQGAT